MNWMAGIGDLVSGLGSLFGHHKNPATGADEYLSQIPGAVAPYYQPYEDAGKQGTQSLEEQVKQLLSDPAGFMNKLGQSYQKSPGFDFSVNQATGAANRAAAAGGMAGSPAEQQELAQTVTGLANQDYNTWLEKVLGLYKEGIGGATDLFRGGEQASMANASDIAQTLAARAKNKFAGTEYDNAASQGKWGGLFAGIGQGLKDMSGMNDTKPNNYNFFGG